MHFNKKVLHNGIRVITVPMKDNPAVTVLVMVEAGSEYETKKISGLSHFLEHMCFKGTTKRPRAIDISRELDSIGSHYNAFTAQEYTGYYAKSHPKYLSKVLDIIADMYINPVFDVKEIEKEKGVIIEEINMYEDMPHRHVHDLFMELLYGDQPAGWNIAGTKESVQGLRREDLIEYRKKQYVAEATTIIVAGNFDEAVIHGALEAAFKGVTTGEKHSKILTVETQDKPRFLIKEKKTDQTHLVIGVRAYNIFSPKIPVLKVLNAIVGGGMSSRLFQKLRDEMGVGYYVHSKAEEYADHGDFAIVTGVDTTRVIEVITAILDQCRKIKNELVSSEELQKAKDYLIGNMYLDLESSDSLAGFYGAQEVLKREVFNPDQIAEKIHAVTAEEVQAVAQEILQNNRLNLALVGKLDDKKVLEKILVI